MLEVTDLMVFFENALALNSLSLEVHQGEIVAVLGGNSAGKTTLMNTVSGLIIDMKKKEERKGGERITVDGQVKFMGEAIQDFRPSARVKRGIVLSRERHPIFQDSSVLENLKIAGYACHSRAMVRDQIDFILELFPHLKRWTKRKAGLLSGGEQQMLSIGMTLMIKPRLLLMDEPLLGLSPMLQENLARTIKNIREEGITILISEQFARPIMPIIDRGYIIENGMLTLSGMRDELADNPEVKASYLGI